MIRFPAFFSFFQVALLLLGVTGFVTPFPARFPYSIKFMAGNSPSPATFALIAAFFIFLGVSPPWPPGQKSAGQVPRGGPGYPLQLPGQKSAGRAIPLLSLTQKHPNPKVLPFIRDMTSRRRRRVPQGQAPSAAGPRPCCCPPPSPTARPAFAGPGGRPSLTLVRSGRHRPPGQTAEEHRGLARVRRRRAPFASLRRPSRAGWRSRPPQATWSLPPRRRAGPGAGGD